jgi:hypothetical protein
MYPPWLPNSLPAFKARSSDSGSAVCFLYLLCSGQQGEGKITLNVLEVEFSLLTNKLFHQFFFLREFVKIPENMSSTLWIVIIKILEEFYFIFYSS